jgi:spermidine/putrescine transport system permease protein
VGGQMISASQRQRSPLLAIYAALVFGFIYLPIVVLILYSFNHDGVGGFPPRHFTLDWYRQLFSDSAIWDSVVNSLIVAAGSVALALILGLLAALALDRASFPGKGLFRRLVLLPLILPGIITGLSLLMLAVSAGKQLGLLTVFLGHGTALISIATTELFAGLQKLDRAQEEASLDLGATPWQTFWRVTLPNLKLSLIAAGLLIFTLSMDEIAVTFFLIGRDNTLPLEIWGRLRRGITPEINAISTLIFGASVALIVIWYRLRARSIGTQAQELLERPRRSMSQSRRDFIKFVVAGSVTAGCPIDSTLTAAPESAPQIESEHFEICHQIRDGHSFERPSPTQKAATVIIGGGVAGLSAAYFLRGQDFLLLEKEDHFGGNAYQEELDGQPFATGSAFAYRNDYGDQLSAELGLKLLPVNNPDPTIVNKTFVADTWKSGIDHLPYPREVRESFRKFRDDILKIKTRQRLAELDSEPFTNYTARYAPEIQQWWDGYGPSNWGATTQDTSAYLGIASLQDIATGEDQRVILPGGLGCITHKLVEVLRPQYNERLVGKATVISVVPAKDEVHVTYYRDGQVITVTAKAAIVCIPKLIASRLISGLPAEQKAAMQRTRYAPYPVVNVIFDRAVYNRGYDTWCPGNSFTDFIVADWMVRNAPGYRQKHNILTFYTPLRENQRFTLLDENNCKALASRVLADFQRLLLEFDANPVEVRLYRRGHPMFMAVPGQFTKNRLIAAQPMDRLFFGNADSGGPESLTSESIRLSRAAAEWSAQVLAGNPNAKPLAKKAVAITSE